MKHGQLLIESMNASAYALLYGACFDVHRMQLGCHIKRYLKAWWLVNESMSAYQSLVVKYET